MAIILIDTVNYANPTTETRTQVLELGPRAGTKTVL